MLLTIYQLPLLVQPAFGLVVPSLEDDVVALQPAGDVVPCCCDHGILALEVLDDLVACRLLFGTKVLLRLVSKAKEELYNITNKKAHYNLIHRPGGWKATNGRTFWAA